MFLGSLYTEWFLGSALALCARGNAFNEYDTLDICHSNKQTNNNDLLEKDGGTKNCIYKD